LTQSNPSSPLSHLPIIDSHIHFIHLERMDDMLSLMDAIPAQRFNLVCLPNLDGTTQNPIALAFKERYPERVFLSGALAYANLPADPGEASTLLARQVHEMKAQGFDGLKFIEGKPQVRKLLPIPLDAPHYAGVWSAAEELGLPVLLHVADPDMFWDPIACPGWARESGWDYSDGTYPSKEDLYTEVEHILDRHPRLKVILAHFYFLAQDLERAARFLDSHPSVCFDLAPHIDMYTEFSHTPSQTIDFFTRYQDRILFGTDSDTRVLERGPQGFEFMRAIPQFIRSFLELDGPILTLGPRDVNGIALPIEILEKIYYANFERVYRG
jgi:predicted TIM-barrel fold metal-dependent hydrolase